MSTQEQTPQQELQKESHILIVDDDSTLLKFFKIHLNKIYSKVIVVPNGKEAMAVIKEKAIDLVLSDNRMPGVDGLELLKKIKRFNAAIPVVLISGAMLDAAQEQDLQENADGFMKKPFDVDALHALIDRNLVKRQHLLKLEQFCKTPKSFKDLVKGKSTVAKSVKKQHVSDAEEIYAVLSQSA